jgi:hypothetical protein
MDRDTLGLLLFAKWSIEARGWPSGDWCEPDWDAWKNDHPLNAGGLDRDTFIQEADHLLEQIKPHLP